MKKEDEEKNLQEKGELRKENEKASEENKPKEDPSQDLKKEKEKKQEPNKNPIINITLLIKEINLNGATVSINFFKNNKEYSENMKQISDELFEVAIRIPEVLKNFQFSIKNSKSQIKENIIREFDVENENKYFFYFVFSYDKKFNISNFFETKKDDSFKILLNSIILDTIKEKVSFYLIFT
jgi:hypothetical protein